MKQLRTLLRLNTAAIILAGLGVASASAQTFAATGTTTLAVNVGAEASIAINTPSTSLSTSGGLFADYTGTTNFTYKVRTGQSSGRGRSFCQSRRTSTEPADQGRHSAERRRRPDVHLHRGGVRYRLRLSPNGQHHGDDLSGDVRRGRAFRKGRRRRFRLRSLTNDPVYKTGSYSATATFTISAT